jgi:hypothetical protein
MDTLGKLPNALVQLQAHYHHCGEAASEKCLSAATFVRPPVEISHVVSHGRGLTGQVHRCSYKRA